MDVKRFFRGPIFWIVVLILVVLLVGDFATRSGGFEDADTYKVVQMIKDDRVESAVLIGGTEQEIRITTKDGSKLRAEYVEGQAGDLARLLQEKSESGALTDGYNVDIAT